MQVEKQILTKINTSDKVGIEIAILYSTYLPTKLNLVLSPEIG